MIRAIKDILAYLRERDPLADYDKAYAEEQRQLKEARRIRKQLPKLIRELEETLAKLKGLVE